MDDELPGREAFPPGFVFGVAMASHQIEGTASGGCGESHWCRFADTPGNILTGENARVACDHVHRWEQDLNLIRDGGFDAYRFSFAWNRLFPHNDSELNPQGRDFYDRLIDGMLERDIAPFATLYHWDLPIRHADNGGWRNRDTALAFGDYTDRVMGLYGDRLARVATINEPWCVAWLSHYLGHHAPGLASVADAARAMHHVLLAHGVGLQAMRGRNFTGAGIVLNNEYAQAADDRPASVEAAERYDGIYNRWFGDAVFCGRYPHDVLPILEPHLPRNYADDLKVIGAPLDWVGLNYYTRGVIAADGNEPHIGLRRGVGDRPTTEMGWEIYPEGLGYFLDRLKAYAPELPVYITENGIACPDHELPAGIQDSSRIAYHKSHLEVVAAAAARGVPVKGYFVWTLIDNFEWAFGTSKRFGLVHTDFATQKRTPKASWYAFQRILRPRR